jgi:hypothetical protein
MRKTLVSFGAVFRHWLVNLDFSLMKNFKFGEERQVQFRSEFFNIVNHPTFDLPNRAFGTPQFGTIFRALATQRQIQFGLRLRY